MAGLFPVFEMPAEIYEEVQTKPQYKMAPLFDMEKGEFVLNGARQIVMWSNYDAWVMWCLKAVMTQRLAHPAYSGDFGIEAIEALARKDRKEIASALEKTITDTLVADSMGRTQYVKNFSFDFKGDSVHVSCVAVGRDGNSATIEAKL